jgi:hypothetical protein
MDGVFEDTEFVAEWGSKKQDQLEKALSECRTSATDLRSCLALELKKLERQ